MGPIRLKRVIGMSPINKIGINQITPCICAIIKVVSPRLESSHGQCLRGEFSQQSGSKKLYLVDPLDVSYVSRKKKPLVVCFFNAFSLSNAGNGCVLNLGGPQLCHMIF